MKSGFCCWSSLRGLALVFCDPPPGLGLSMLQGRCRSLTKPGLKHSTWINHEILLVRASLGPLTHIVWWNSAMPWSSLDFKIPSASQESSASKQQKQVYAAAISSFATPRRWAAWGNKDGPKHFLLTTLFSLQTGGSHGPNTALCVQGTVLCKLFSLQG